MREQIPVKDIETAEAIATKLTELGLRPCVRYKSTFEKVGRVLKRVKRASAKIEVIDWIIFVDTLEQFREIEKKLLTVAPSWKKTPLYNGTGISLDTNIGKVAVDINIEFREDKVISIMSKILNCEIEQVREEIPASTSVRFACKTK